MLLQILFQSAMYYRCETYNVDGIFTLVSFSVSRRFVFAHIYHHTCSGHRINTKLGAAQD